jgi:hypothetical protein
MGFGVFYNGAERNAMALSADGEVILLSRCSRSATGKACCGRGG